MFQYPTGNVKLEVFGSLGSLGSLMIRGRCIQISSDRREAWIQNENGVFKHLLPLEQEDLLFIGDIIEAGNTSVKILTKNLLSRKIPASNSLSPWGRHLLNSRRIHAMKIRSRVEQSVRRFFLDQDFHEVRTPLLVPNPGMEPHIRPFLVSNPSARPIYLPTSPEFAMKRLLAGGLEKIFQICPAFRDEPESPTHSPEFTCLEWYRAYSTYEEIMVDVENLFLALVKDLFQKTEFQYQGELISVAPPWPRLRIRDLFLKFANIDLVKCEDSSKLDAACQELGFKPHLDESWDDLFFKIWLNQIENKLPKNQAVFVTRYPASQAALAVVDQDSDQSSWARRFEVFAGGLELGNAFEELTDPVEQEKRFRKDMRLREKVYGDRFPATPIDEGFLHALREGIPPCSGIAVGIDRVVMLLANEPDIFKTFWMKSIHPDEFEIDR